MIGLTMTSSNTWDQSDNSHLLSVVEDEDGTWIVSEHNTRVYGHGRTLLEAMCDFWAALHSHLSVMESGPVSEPLAREARAIRRLLSLPARPAAAAAGEEREAR